MELFSVQTDRKNDNFQIIANYNYLWPKSAQDDPLQIKLKMYQEWESYTVRHWEKHELLYEILYQAESVFTLLGHKNLGWKNRIQFWVSGRVVVININVTYFMYDSVYSSAFDFCDNIWGKSNFM